MCIDEGKFYTVMEVVYIGIESFYSDRELLYGRYLIGNKNTILIKFLEKERNKYLNIISNEGLNTERKEELLKRLNIIEETVDEMQ